MIIYVIIYYIKEPLHFELINLNVKSSFIEEHNNRFTMVDCLRIRECYVPINQTAFILYNLQNIFW